MFTTCKTLKTHTSFELENLITEKEGRRISRTGIYAFRMGTLVQSMFYTRLFGPSYTTGVLTSSSLLSRPCCSHHASPRLLV